MDFFSQVIRNSGGAACVLRSITIVKHGAVVIYDRTECELTYTCVSFVNHRGDVPQTINAGGKL